MAEDIPRLRAVRAGNRSVVTKLTNEVAAIFEQPELDAKTRDRLQRIDTILTQKMDLLDQLNDQIIAVCKVEEIEKEIGDAEDLKMRIMDARADISTKTTPPTLVTTNPSETTPPPAPQQGNHSPSISGSNQTTLQAKLPKITLPKFNGEITNWISFWDSFNSAVHANTSLSRVSKFNYLNSLLEGVAKRAVQGLTLSDANYDAAVEILEQRFGKPQQIISAHMDEILKIPQCTSDRPASLRLVYDKLSVHVGGLKSLGVSSEQYGSLLIPIVMSKLPNDIRLQIARNTTSEVWKIEELTERIRIEMEAREASERVKAVEPTSSHPGQPRRPEFHGKLKATAGTFLVESPPTPFTPTCVYCNGQHFSASCEKVKGISERKAILGRNKRCFMCLRRGHQQGQCDKNCKRCDRRHHQSICPQLAANANAPGNTRTQAHSFVSVDNSSQQEPSEPITETENTTTATTTTSENANPKTRVLLQIARAIATNENGTRSTTVRLLFDNGSQRSYVTDSLRSKLQLKPVQTERLNLNTFGESRYKKQDCDVVNFQIRKAGTDDHDAINISALTFPVICSPLPSKVSVNHPHLYGLDFADEPFDSQVSSESIDILIGSDYYWDFVTGETKRGDDGPIAVKSTLGWLLSGRVNGTIDPVTHSNLIIEGQNSLFAPSQDQDDILTNTLKEFWETESIGIKDLPADQDTRKESFAIDVKLNGGRYEVKLPWKEDCLPSSDHYQLCENRLRSLHHKLRKDPALLTEYDNIIQEQLNTGIIEEVSNGDFNNEKAAQIHYLPHHAVVRKDRETTKVRIVYDGSAKTSKDDNSLNDCLETGPNCIPHVFDMLANFRRNTVGLTADVEKAFLMVGIQADHRNFLRFLWFENPRLEKPKIVHYKFTRLVFGLRPSPAILGETIRHHLELHKQSDPEIAELLANSLYVDDLLTGESGDDKALTIYKRAKKIMSEGGFNLRKWRSNSRKRQEAIAQEESFKQEGESYAKPSTNLNGAPPNDEDAFVKVLGMNWNTVTDEILFDFSELSAYASSLPLSKRSVLKVTAKIFDPIGFLTPLTVEMKILFQELCIEKTNWDDELQGNFLQRWKLFLDELKYIDCYRIPRCYFSRQPVDIQVHGFSDASERAYAAVVYLRSTYSDGQIDVRLIASKSRVAPIKRQTIPRLELLGALILARLVTKLRSIGTEYPTVLWSDSTTTLCWIKNANERTWKQYVQHRVEEIHESTSRDEWRYCPGKQNPADLPSRGLSAKELSVATVWWNGPEFLYRPESEWPETQLIHSEDELVLQEAAKNQAAVTHSLVNNSTGEPRNPTIDQVINIKRFGDLTKLLRVTAFVVKFVTNLKNKVRNVTKPENGREVLNASDLTKAEELWIRAVQASSFAEEIKFLQNHRQNKATPPSYVTQFGLFLDQGVMKCKGRMNNSELPVNARNPILLPAKHEFVRLIIKDVHESTHHSGIRDTLTTIRERFWILRGREAVKQMIKKCVICLRIDGKPYKSQPPTDLPTERVSEDPPFTHVGLDFAGPLVIANGNSNESKVYICLFTCAATRAIHLELCGSLNAQNFLLAFRRFVSRRGLPATLTSDNAKTFKSSSKEIRKITRSNEVWRYLVDQRISWSFIVEKAPWWGGFWERLVRSVKRPLKKVLGRSTQNFEELRTILVEIESVINARPITYLYDDANSISYPLTPADLIYGRRVTSTPNGAHHEIISTHQSLTRRARHHKNLLQQVTKQWRQEYLTSLREQSNVGNNRNGAQEILIGDIVLLKNDSTKRIFWKLARVEELIPGADGRVRAAIVQVGSDDKPPSYLRRVVQHLIPIEVKSIENNEVTQLDGNPVPDQAVRHDNRPRRNAAVVGEINRREMNII